MLEAFISRILEARLKRLQPKLETVIPAIFHGNITVSQAEV
jgi:hypothetical protein